MGLLFSLSLDCVKCKYIQSTYNCTKHNTIKVIICLFSAVFQPYFYCMLQYLLYRNHRRASTAYAKAAHDLEMVAEGRPRNNPLPRGNDHVYTNDGVPVERNPSYEMVQYN